MNAQANSAAAGDTPRPAPASSVRLLANTAWLTAANLIARIIGYGGFILLARAYSSADVGTYAVLVTGMIFAELAGNLSLDKILVRDLARGAEDPAGLVSAALLLKLCASVLGAGAITVLLFAMYPEFGGIRPQVVVYMSGAVPVAMARLVESLYMARERMMEPALAQLAERGTQFLILLGAWLGWYGFPVLLLLLPATGIVRLCALLCMTGEHGNELARLLRALPGHIRACPPAMRQLLSEAARLLAVEVMAGIYFRIDVFLLARMTTFSDTGLYHVAYRVLDVMAAVFTGYLAAVFPMLARRGRGAPFTVIILSGLVVMVPASLGVIAFRAEILGLFGTAYGQAATVLVWLMAACPLVYIASMFANIAIAMGRIGMLVRLAFAMMTLNVALNLLLIPFYSITGAAIATFVCECVSLVLFTAGLRDVLWAPAEPATEAGAPR